MRVGNQLGKALDLSSLRNRWLGMRDRFWRSFARRQLILKSKLVDPTERSAVIFAPHHDDETLGCGGIIATKRQRGAPVWVVFLTDGSKCYPESVPMTPEEISNLRRREAFQALEIWALTRCMCIFSSIPMGDCNTCWNRRDKLF
ncbi:hypothetical protein BH20PSE1_BH20PSE1_22230 [soil metagenome]